MGYPGTEKGYQPLSLDTYFEFIYPFERIQLIKIINTQSMDVGLIEDKMISMLDKLSHWHQHSRSFILLQGSMLCGNFEFWSITSPWER